VRERLRTPLPPFLWESVRVPTVYEEGWVGARTAAGVAEGPGDVVLYDRWWQGVRMGSARPVGTLAGEAATAAGGSGLHFAGGALGGEPLRSIALWLEGA
jgi:hypothetical protein